MNSSKRYLPILISIALLGLISLQIAWLFLVFKQKEQELCEKTQEAVVETSNRLKEKEDQELIIQDMDSLLVTDNIIGSGSKEEMRVMVSSIKNKLRIDTIKGIKTNHEINIINDSSQSTTIVNLSNGKMKEIYISSSSDPRKGYQDHLNEYQKVMREYQRFMGEYQIHSKEYQRLAKEAKEQTSKEKYQELQQRAKKEEMIAKEFEAHAKEFEEQVKEQEALAKEQETLAKELEKEAKVHEKESKEHQFEREVVEKQKLKRKVKELQTVFFKMALNSGTAIKNIDSAFSYNKIKPLLNEELLKQGIDLHPEFALYFFPDRHPAKIKYHVICSTPDFGKMLPALVNVPFYRENMYEGQMIMKIDYMSTTNFVLKQMAGLLGLSLFITILIGFVMIYLFRRMLSQEKLHQLKNDLINNMAHELKTPIATISLAVDGISNPAIKNDNEKFNAYTSILKEENKKLNTHVERVLQSALLEKGELTLEKKEIDLNSLLMNCLDTYQLQIQNKKAKVSFTSHENIKMTGDTFHLSNAFTNLLDNALKYSKENCEIEISLMKNGNYAEIRYKDNGIGIPRELQSKVFEKFYRVQGGNLHDVKGSGLGLSYVKSIIEKHGGTIELISEENQGSEFIIKLALNAN
jgi:signal transduction histidine kinase